MGGAPKISGEMSRGNSTKLTPDVVSERLNS